MEILCGESRLLRRVVSRGRPRIGCSLEPPTNRNRGQRTSGNSVFTPENPRHPCSTFASPRVLLPPYFVRSCSLHGIMGLTGKYSHNVKQKHPKPRLRSRKIRVNLYQKLFLKMTIKYPLLLSTRLWYFIHSIKKKEENALRSKILIYESDEMSDRKESLDIKCCFGN